MHWNATLASLSLKLNVAVVEVDGFGGCEVITGVGGATVAIVNLAVAGERPGVVLPTSSVART
jgi:hypothetical protein